MERPQNNCSDQPETGNWRRMTSLDIETVYEMISKYDKFLPATFQHVGNKFTSLNSIQTAVKSRKEKLLRSEAWMRVHIDVKNLRTKNDSVYLIWYGHAQVSIKANKGIDRSTGWRKSIIPFRVSKNTRSYRTYYNSSDGISTKIFAEEVIHGRGKL